jgi:CBS domain-containing protein
MRWGAGAAAEIAHGLRPVGERPHALRAAREISAIFRVERFLLEGGAEAMMDVRELMTSPVRTLTVEDTLNCAAKLMQDHSLGCIPIVDDDGRLAGILTDRDIALAAHASGEALWRLRIADTMHAPVFTCGPGDGVEIAARTMREHRVHRLPVVDAERRPIGLISLDDLAHASRQPMLDPHPGLTSDEIDDTYDAVSGRAKGHSRKEVH